MEMEYAMDDPRSPTDSSEDSVEVRVEAITNRHKRKLAEPRRFNSGPLKKRLCVRTTDHSSQPFRPWHQKENNNNNNKEEDGREGAREQFYKTDGNEGIICNQPPAPNANGIKECEEEEPVNFHPRLMSSEADAPSSFQPTAVARLRSSEAYFQPPVVFIGRLEDENIISEPLGMSYVKAVTSSEDEESRGACFQPPRLINGTSEDEGESKGGCFQPRRTSYVEVGSKIGCFQPPRTSKDEGESKSGRFQPRRTSGDEEESKGGCFQPQRTSEDGGESKGGYFQPRRTSENEESSKGGLIQTQVRIERTSEDEEESKGGYFQARRTSGDEESSKGGFIQAQVRIKRASELEEESKSGYFQPPAVLARSYEATQRTPEEEVLSNRILESFQPRPDVGEVLLNHQAPLDLVKNQPGRIKLEPQSPRIPTHPKPEDSIERAEELISGAMLSFPKLSQQQGNFAGVGAPHQKTFKSEEGTRYESVDEQNYKSPPSAEQQNHQRNYKNMTRERRIEANARERTRVHTISAAFETLRKSVPAYSDKQKLSKLSVLRIACSYIATLENLLSDDVNEELLEESVERVSGTIQREGKLRKKKDED